MYLCAGSGTPSEHCLAAQGQWAVELLECTASLPVRSGQWNSFYVPPHCFWAAGNGTTSVHCLTAGGQSFSTLPALG